MRWAEVSTGTVSRMTVSQDVSTGAEWLAENVGGTWVSAPLDENIGVGFTYTKKDGFLPPKPFPSWVLNKDTGFWKAPVPYPTDGRMYKWDESIVNWVPVSDPE